MSAVSRLSNQAKALVVLAAILAFAVAGASIAGTKDARKGYLGVYMQQLDDDVREGLDLGVKHGVLISGVEDGSPADEAGIEDGDVIVEFDGKRVENPDELRDLVRDTEPGQEVEIKVFRDGKEKSLELVVGEWDDEFSWVTPGTFRFDSGDWGDVQGLVGAFAAKPRLGVEVAELNDDLAPYFKTSAGKGVLVLEVNDDSVADEAGIKSGDVIQSVGGEDVSTAKALRESLEDYEEGDEVEIVLLRKGKKTTVKAKMDDSLESFHWSGSRPHMETYKFDGVPKAYKFYSKSPRMRIHTEGDDLLEEIEQLKQELREMKKEINELKKG